MDTLYTLSTDVDVYVTSSNRNMKVLSSPTANQSRRGKETKRKKSSNLKLFQWQKIHGESPLLLEDYCSAHRVPYNINIVEVKSYNKLRKLLS